MRTGARPFHTVEKASIFVVEADEVIRSALQFILREDETSAFASGEAALRGATVRAPDLILLGIDLVRGSDQVLAQLAGRSPGARILLVADSAADSLARDCLLRGAHDVLGKPITIDAVRDTVDRLLGRERPPARPRAQPAAVAV